MAQVEHVLASLSEPQRVAVCLKYLNGWPHTEIAECLGKTPQEVAALVYRGMKRLREFFGESEGE